MVNIIHQVLFWVTNSYYLLVIFMLDIIRSYFKDEKYYIVMFNDGVYIKNYNNILSLTEDELLININEILYRVKGKNFILSKTVGKELTVNGSIESIEKI